MHPPYAQDIYREAFNHAYAVHLDDLGRDEAAHRIAWAAVKRSSRRIAAVPLIVVKGTHRNLGNDKRELFQLTGIDSCSSHGGGLAQADPVCAAGTQLWKGLS